MKVVPVGIRDNLVEVACARCRRKLGGTQVLHRFALDGELVETVVLP